MGANEVAVVLLILAHGQQRHVTLDAGATFDRNTLYGLLSVSRISGCSGCWFRSVRRSVMGRGVSAYGCVVQAWGRFLEWMMCAGGWRGDLSLGMGLLMSVWRGFSGGAPGGVSRHRLGVVVVAVLMVALGLPASAAVAAAGVPVAASPAVVGSVPLAEDGTAAAAVSSGAVFVPVAPARVYDSRWGSVAGLVLGRLSSGGSRTVSVADGRNLDSGGVTAAGVVPAGAVAVAYNVTLADTAGQGFVTVAPGGATAVASSTVNWSGSGQQIANGLAVGVDGARAVKVFAGGGGSTQIIVDVVGYFLLETVKVDGGVLTPITPVRAYDSRSPGAGGVLASGQSRVVALNPAATIPDSATAVAYNVTVAGTTAGGYLTVAPGDAAAVTSSTLNWSTGGELMSNGLVVGLDGQKQIRVFAGGGSAEHFIIDVVGYYTPADSTPAGGRFFPLDPVRAYDSRAGLPAPGQLASGGSRRVSMAAGRDLATGAVTAPAVLPVGAAAVVFNATVAATTSAGFLAVVPGDASSSPVSTLNWSAPETVRANGSIVGVDGVRYVNMLAGGGGATHTILDVVGYYSPPPAPDAVTVKSTGGQVTATVAGTQVIAPAGAIAAGQTLTVAREPGTALPGGGVAGSVVNITTSQGQPTAPVRVRFTFDPTTVEKPLILHEQEPGLWLPEDTTVVAPGMAEAAFDHFSRGGFADWFVFAVGNLTGNRAALPSPCNQPPPWVAYHNFSNKDTNVGSALFICAAPGTDNDALKIAVTNNRGYPLVMRITGAQFDFEGASWPGSAVGLINKAIARSANAAARYSDLVVLEPGQTTTVKIARTPGFVNVSIDAQAQKATQAAGLVISMLNLDSRLGQSAKLVDCYASTIKSVSANGSNLDALSAVRSCSEAALSADYWKDLKVPEIDKITKSLGKLAKAVLIVDVAQRFADAWVDGVTIPRIYFSTITPGAGAATRIADGFSHTCAMVDGGQVKCWGGNVYGELGDGSTEGRWVPELVAGLSGVTALAAGDSHTCALVAGGQVKCWGRNWAGQLGDGTNTNRWTPVAVAGLSGVTALAAGGHHTCAVVAGGQVKCWGSNSEGQLGDGTDTDRATPVTVIGLSGVTALGAGFIQTCAVVAGVQVKCWGNNGFAELGDGTYTDRWTPVAVVGLSGATALAAGHGHTCAVVADGQVKCWGSNGNGGLGDGTNTDRATPVAVVGLSGATVLVSGSGHTCAVVAGGQVKCWGYNRYGQLGDGTDTDRATPVTVIGLSGVTALSTGPYSACVVVASGQVKCWGWQVNRKFDGTNDNRWTPVTKYGITVA